MTCEIIYEDADIAELKNLKALATRPVVIDAMENLLKDCQQHIQTRRLSNTSKPSFSSVITNTTTTIREPISRSKANIQTIYITSGYAWGQSDEFIIIYLPIKNARKICPEQYTLQVQPRAVQLDINEHEGANYNFRISQLHGYVTLEHSKIKLKESKLVIYLRKETIGKNWTDLRLKTTRDMYDQLKRAESSNTTGNTSPTSNNNSAKYGSNTSNNDNNVNTMDTIVREIYQNTDTQTRQKIQEPWRQVNKNPFVVEEHCQHQHPHSS